MTIHRLCCLLILTLVAIPAMAQSPAGRWKTNIDTPRGRFPLIFEFAINGDKLTGTVSNDFLPKFPIEDGAIKGSELSFKMRLQTVTLAYSGRLKGSELLLTSKTVEERASAAASGSTLGDVLRSANVLTATRDK